MDHISQKQCRSSLSSQADCAAIVLLCMAPCTSNPPLLISAPPPLLPGPAQDVPSQLGTSKKDNVTLGGVAQNEFDGGLPVPTTLTQHVDIVPPGGVKFVIIMDGESPCLVGGSSDTVVGEQLPPTPTVEIQLVSFPEQGDCGEGSARGGEPSVLISRSDKVLSQEPPPKLSVAITFAELCFGTKG
ncbi:hypothetical protein H6P81_006895 [Aristolochia fimbriata]|uniref:Uncharacterized protein n=1 Tax=Aristolochia fimbriata TaxID=158543 RepID=A0AAV7F2C2_ARIFI|nr:hypothetical protein H6P81_006895 [Aristolochia fimbriata]